MSPTNEQIIAEARRRAAKVGEYESYDHFIIEVVRENWTPPEPVDPDLLAFREWAAGQWPPAANYLYQRGLADNGREAQAYLAGARMGREQERERAKVLVEFAKLMADKSIFPEVSLRALAALAKYRGAV